jgi:short subunit dehydrogenase-like uncharacterized protein
VDHCVFGLEDSAGMDKALRDAAVVLHCAGPYIHTYKPMAEACLRTGTHYLDLTGEIAVLEALVGYDTEAKTRKVMLLPAVGFDVVPSDCLALHLKQRLPTATQLALAYHSRGPARNSHHDDGDDPLWRHGAAQWSAGALSARGEVPHD